MEEKMQDGNPYDAPDFHEAAECPPRRDSRRDIEGVVAITVTLLLAGAWGALRLLGRGSFLQLLAVTLGVLLGSLAYALAARRWRALWLLPGVLLAIVGNTFVASAFFLGAALWAPMALLAAAMRPTREKWILAGKLILVALTAMESIRLFGHLRLFAAQGAAERGGALIEAIDRFQTREGRLPGSLDELVPRDLTSIPDTGMMGYRSFEYLGPTPEDADEERLFRTYEIRVNLYQFLQFDSLVYWPERNYPDFMYGGGVEPIGDWAYVHE
jgi:hypothetical protein